MAFEGTFGKGGIAEGGGGGVTSFGGSGRSLTGAAKKGWGAYLDATDRDKADMLGRLGGEAGRASGFAAGAQQDFAGLGGEATAERDYLRRIARGDESVSRLQLAQALQQNQAQQQGMAAGARPGQSAMAARTAAMTAGRQGAGLAGQQAIAGIQERQAAQNALAQNLMRQREQELQAALTSRGQAIGGFGTAFTGSMQQPTGAERGLGLLVSGGQLAAGLG